MTVGPFRRTVATVRAVSVEAAAIAGHLLLYPSGIPPEPWPLHRPSCDHLPGVAPARTEVPVGCPHLAAAPAGHAPVILLHGLADNRSVFALLRRDLRRHGWQHVHALNYSPLTMDVRAAAVLLGRHVQHTRRIYGGERIVIVGHSLGGLIARHYVQRLGGDEHVHTLVTLGTPHQGTHAARLPSVLPIIRQLRPGSGLLAELDEPAPGCRTRFVSIRGDLDQLVLPQGNARLIHPDLHARNILLKGVGHLTLPMHCRTAALVRGALTAAARETPLETAPRLTA